MPQVQSGDGSPLELVLRPERPVLPTRFPSLHFPPIAYPPVVDMHEALGPVRVEADAALAGQRGEVAQVVDRDAVHVDVHGMEESAFILHVQRCLGTAACRVGEFRAEPRMHHEGPVYLIGREEGLHPGGGLQQPHRGAGGPARLRVAQQPACLPVALARFDVDQPPLLVPLQPQGTRQRLAGQAGHGGCHYGGGGQFQEIPSA